MTHKAVLIIVFNHKYDKNIEKLEQLYKDRFSAIYFLVPFYNGSRPDVISVYENSFYFQGYFAQGFKSFFNKEAEHYLFIGDDLILNPAINENNYQEYFNVDASSSFIPEIYTLNNVHNNSTLDVFPVSLKDKLNKQNPAAINKWFWKRVIHAYKYKTANAGVESAKELPSYEEALAKIQKHGYTIEPLTFADLYGGFPKPEDLTKVKTSVQYLFNQVIRKKKYHLSYPLVGSYSDIVIVSGQAIKDFTHYCGVFAVNELFVEQAIPTALLLASEKVVTETANSKRGLIYWNNDVLKSDLKKFSYKLNNLLSDFPEEKLYIHPIKLSQWT